MKLYLIAGEASGDLHGSNLIKALLQQQPNLQLRGWGGDKMEAAGATLVKHYRHLAFMGFAEVLMNLRTILRNISFCKQDIAQYNPDAIILIDYPGFNLRIAKWAKAAGYKVIYYISPQVWAWKAGRVKQMKQTIDLMLTILPFEKAWYAQHWQWPVHYVGHPLVSVIESYTPKINSFSTKPVVALLPGSRRQEIQAKLPVMLQVADRFPQYDFIVAKAPALPDDFYKTLLQPYANVKSVGGLTYDLLLQAKAAMVTSGTATLETALFKVPQVVCYKGNPISYAIARRLIKIKYISLVNLILDAPVVTELIQHQLTPNALAAELEKLLHNHDTRQRLQQQYQQLNEVLKAGGNASTNAARMIMQFLQTA
ncbi:MAG TPA: lipid-A-disaccharide synthase [Phnomibacter sp.]|nr:lipid-A-disaccharide synthase [Phnomibacter sp.]